MLEKAANGMQHPATAISELSLGLPTNSAIGREKMIINPQINKEKIKLVQNATLVD